jgi:predicted phosphoribosyltransferase
MVTRSEVARELVAALREHAGRHGVYVIVVAPGSLWLAAEVARQLRVPFDLFPVRTVHDAEDEQGPPVGLVGSGGVLVVDQATVAARGCSLAALAEAAQAAARALVGFEREIRGGAEPPDLRSSTIILLDDGRTPVQILRMAITALRQCWVKVTILARPTITRSDLDLVRTEADAIVSAVVRDEAARGDVPERPAEATVAEIRQILRGARPAEAGRAQQPAGAPSGRNLAMSSVGAWLSG